MTSSEIFGSLWLGVLDTALGTCARVCSKTPALRVYVCEHTYGSFCNAWSYVGAQMHTSERKLSNSLCGELCEDQDLVADVLGHQSTLEDPPETRHGSDKPKASKKKPKKKKGGKKSSGKPMNEEL